MKPDFRQLTEEFAAWFSSLERQDAATTLASGASTGSEEADFGSGVAAGDLIMIVDHRSQGRGRAVVAQQDIVPDTTLFTVDHADILSLANSDARMLIAPSELSLLPPWIACVLAIIYESGQGAQSKWWPYIAILPDRFDTLMYWSQEELLELQGSHVTGKIGKSSAEEMVEEYLWPIVRQKADHFGSYADAFSDPNDGRAREALYELAHRFATIVLAYAFDLDQDSSGDEKSEQDAEEDGFVEESAPPKGMVPFADLLNAEGEDYNNARLFHEDKSVSMVAIKPIKSGEEILNDYGSLPNAELLRCYGYVSDAYKPHDVTEISSEILAAAVREGLGFSEKQIEKRFDLADSWGVLDDSYDMARSPSSEHPIDHDLILLLIALAASDERYGELKKLKQRPKAALDPTTRRLLASAIRKRQHDYSTSVAEDVALLSAISQSSRTDGFPTRREMAIRVRLGEKEVLAQNLAYVQDGGTGGSATGGGSTNGAHVEISSDNDEEPARKKPKTN